MANLEVTDLEVRVTDEVHLSEDLGVLVLDEAFLRHEPGRWHPESPMRLMAIADRLRERPTLVEALDFEEAAPAPVEAIARVHNGDYLALLDTLDAHGGGALDRETALSAGSLDAARKAAGAGLEAIRRVERGAPFAYCLVRPPGHHARADRGMGFCLMNNVAVAAAALRARGLRVAIVDWDAHHGNGTQDIFYGDQDVLYVSLHEFPQYPWTGRISEVGAGAGTGRTLNLPLPAGTGEATYLAAFDEVIAPVVTDFAPDWILVSCGYDAHRSDPMTDLALRATSFGLLTQRTRHLAARLCHGRLVVFLEGGYDLNALANSTEATLAALVGMNASIDEPPAKEDMSPIARKVLRIASEHMSHYWNLF